MFPLVTYSNMTSSEVGRDCLLFQVVKVSVLRQISEGKALLDASRESPDVLALIIDGNSLTYALEDDAKDMFLDLAIGCASVICCRSSPKQKALVSRAMFVIFSCTSSFTIICRIVIIFLNKIRFYLYFFSFLSLLKSLWTADNNLDFGPANYDELHKKKHKDNLVMLCRIEIKMGSVLHLLCYAVAGS